LKRRGQLPADRIEILDKFGFLWDQPHARQSNNWEVLYEQAIQFKKEHGHLDVPKNSMLNWWMALQRSYKKSNKLPEERIRDLEALDFQWSPRPSRKVRGDDAHEQIVPNIRLDASSPKKHFLRAVSLDAADM
jgi:hypothetical protein